LKNVLNQNQVAGWADAIPVQNKNKKCLWPHTDSGFCGLATQNNDKITQGWLKANLKDH
jgi:hypothetical protein